MKLSEFRNALATLSELRIQQPDGEYVPQHFHITEAGLNTKHYVDCGGTIRNEKSLSIQLWVANDVQHRLSPQKLLGILGIAQPLFGNDDLDVDVEYQTDTVGRYGIEFADGTFRLTPTYTNCLALDRCGIPDHEYMQQEYVQTAKRKIKLSELQTAAAPSCDPSSGCCS